ncbi:hypothetical protein BKH43_04850 [Helicobacter sp. 13S00401-1]|uniref:outer membrane family protein n=1 Tax=Helicobacter sp. 13S00401-1 TaxID=1905758 RepID=UPI000BA56A6D|nr:outer membrane family protein [Helicobacter sp. 13S00401-1]PAF50237.1 hypothetical protein BKH43_04850 [Helicobacter sp. 13S00401-1]
MRSIFTKGSVLVLAASLVGTLAFGEGSANVNQAGVAKRPIVMLDGYVGTFSKFGLNDQSIDNKTGQYPTESFTSLITQLDLNIDPSEKLGWEDTSLTFDIGATLGGLAYDSTKFADNSGFSGADGTGGLGYNYVGYWGGYINQGANGNNARNIMVHNAYLNFKSKYFDFQGGRYESKIDYFSGYTQGFTTSVHFKFAGDHEARFWWQSSWGRAQAYSEWLYDYYAPTAGWENTGRSVANNPNLKGVHAGGIDIKVQNADGSHNVLLRPFVYFTPGVFTAVGGKAVAAYGNSDFKSTTTLQGYWVKVANEEWNLAGTPGNLQLIDGIRYAKGQVIDQNSYNLALIQKFNMKNYDFGFGLYKNFGMANAYMGSIGNSALSDIDVYSNSVYEIGQSLSAVVGRRAFTSYLWVGGNHDVKIGTLTWRLQGRYTTSDRAEEPALTLDLYQQFKMFGVGFTAEWMRDYTNRGFMVGSYNKVASNFAPRVDDRSHIYFYIDYKFSSGVKAFMRKSYKKV